MRFLMVCMQFPTGEGQSYLTTELADALVSAGHTVEVLLLDWRAAPGVAPSSFTRRTGVRVVRCTPRMIGTARSLAGKATKFICSGRHVAQVAREHFDLASFDVAITWMPALAIAPLLPMLEAAGVEHRLLFIWDFFPDHHHEIGRIPGGLPYYAAGAWERRLVRHFTAIICTLPGNADYLRRNYPLTPGQQVLVTPIWTDISPRPAVDLERLRARHGLPAGRPIAVFGGQLVAGRGFEQMLGAANAALADGSPLLFLFVGDGPLAAVLRERAAMQANIIYLPPLTREAYLDLLAACDVGMVATVPGVTSFSIPSKTVDYLRSGLPVVAAVEHGSDFIDILQRYGVGRVVPFNDPVQFKREAERQATDPDVRSQVRNAAPRCLEEVFDVRHAVATIMTAVGAEV
ncbi:MAG TPA: glycosyltransferase family 4 protein [Sphingomicrobium sp.]|nr:glycosyltransferase family 4 protein [Sphingomicrobium sp.]